MIRVFADAGGTRTRLWTEDERGRVLRRTVFRSDEARLPAKIRAFLKGRPADRLVIGLRGVWTAPERSGWKRALRGLARSIDTLSDIEFHHRRAFGAGAGVVLNGGTGSIAFARGDGGRTARAGGLGPLIGDEGSAFWIGREFLRNADGTEMAIRRLVTAPDPVRRIAALAKKVMGSAGRNRLARRITTQAQEALARLAARAARDARAGRGTAVELVGGLFSDERFRRGVERRLRRAGLKPR